ncbi:MAG: shikimate dehydrogenase [Deltaproteobacteria bacterium]|nr:shikimate dehydrogenase [Deltaproteobacteria bacterium]
MSAKLVVTLAPKLAAGDAIAFARRARAHGAELLELRTDLHRAGELDVPALARCIGLVVAERGAAAPPAWRQGAALFDRELDAGEAAGASLVSLHAERPLSPSEALTRWGVVAPGPLVKHVEPLTATSRAGIREALARLLETRARLEQRFGAGRVTVLVTGPLALPLRALLAEGNALDYVALEPAWQAAPGQRLLDDAARAARAATTSERLAILGTGIAGSRSPRVHRAPFDRIELADDAPVEELIAALHPHYRGFAITSPFKRRAARIANSELEAVNTLVRTAEGYRGANTDVVGAGAVLAALAPRGSHQAGVTVLGDGGAAAALRVAAASRGFELHVLKRQGVRAPMGGAVVWTWPARVPVPAALTFDHARVAVIAYGSAARTIADIVKERGGVPCLLGPRWFVAQARAQRELWEEARRS